MDYIGGVWGNRPESTGNTATVLEEWDPAARPIHCSNCRHTRVHGDGSYLVVDCTKGHGKDYSLWRVCRAKNPQGFAMASMCLDFESMDDAPVASAPRGLEVENGRREGDS